ncbi:MAG: VWA domain-containing protein [Anaerolineales bacterium]|nr:VWA domain-containing protein [Anaerolineales bacterium]MCB9129061.1 VWA domain-containing protein [Ardenticatenales bacterium]
MPLFNVVPHPIETQLLANANQRRADVVFDVTTDQVVAQSAGSARTLWSLILDSSGSMSGGKMRALQEAVKGLLTHLPNDPKFELQVGFFHTYARELIPPTPAPQILADLRGAQRIIDRLKAEGTTSMGRGLDLALDAFRSRPDAIRRVLLLSDGEQQGDESISRVYQVARTINEIGGQIEAWGVGRDWNADELGTIAALTGGTAAVIPTPDEMSDAIDLLLDDVVATAAQEVTLLFRTPQMYEILEVKQVYPNIAPAVANKISDQEFAIPLGTVTGQGAKILVRIQGVERPAGLAVRAIKPELRYLRDGVVNNEALPPSANAFLKWVDDPTQIQPRDPVVARFRGEEEVLRLQQEGFAALEAGQTDLATARLTEALEAAQKSGSLATAQLQALFDPKTGQLKGNANSVEVKTAKLLSGQTGRLSSHTGRLS